MYNYPTVMSSSNRRSFLKLFASGTLGAFALTSCEVQTDSAMAFKTNPANIALQLWSVRNQIEQDTAGTLSKIAEMGYRTVETAFFPDHISVADSGKLLKNAGLSVCAIHCELPIDEKSKSDMLAKAEAYHCSRVVWHGWPEDARYKTIKGTLEIAEIYNTASEFASSNGLEFGIHNHWWEFEKHEEGHTPFELLLEKVDPNVFFELDTYWIKVAGKNPADVVKQFGDRAPLLHIKDGPAHWTESLDKDEPEPMTAVGQGAQNFPEIVQAANGSTEWMIVEIDNCATDMMTAVKESFDYLIDNRLAKAG